MPLRLVAESKIKKEKRSLFDLKQAISKQWGPKPAYIKWAYNLFIKTRLLYRAVVWGVALGHKNIEDKVNKLNFLAASMMSNTRRSTPGIALTIIIERRLTRIDVVC